MSERFLARLGLALFLALMLAVAGCKKEGGGDSGGDDSSESKEGEGKGENKDDSPADDKSADAADKGDATEDALADRPSKVAEWMLGAGKLKPGPFFQYIPANTPYVLATFEPIPAEVYGAFFKGMDSFDALLEEGLKETKGSKREEDKIAQAVFEELKGKLNPAGFEELGFTMSPHFAIYGIGPLPVIRISLKSGQALRDTIARVEKKAGVTLPREKEGDVEYFSGTEDGMKFAIAILDDHLVVSFGPEKAFGRMLPTVLGAKKPDSSMADGAALRKVVSQYGFSPYGVGYVDFRHIFDGTLGRESGLTGEIWKEVAGAEKAPPPACAKEVDALLKRFPRVAFGYDELSDSAMSFTAVLEMEPELASDLRKLAVEMPGLNSKTGRDSTFAFGLAMNLNEVRNMGKRFAEGMQTFGKACDDADMISGGEEMLQGLSQPMPPGISGLRGILAEVIEGDFSGNEPKNLQAYVAIHADDPKGLLAVAKQFSGLVPGSEAAVDFPADGKFHSLKVPVPKPIVDGVHGAASDKMIIFAGGPKGRGAAEKLLTAKATMSPLVLLSIDSGEVMKKSFAEMPAPKGEADKAAQEFLKGKTASWGTTGMWLYTARRGLGFRMRMSLNN